METLDRLDAIGLASAVRAGELGPVEVVNAAIARVEKCNPALNAVIHQSFERARAHAQSLESIAVDDRPPLAGVPFLLKDLGGEEAGQPCHAGMLALKDAAWIEANDSYFAARLRRAGIVTLGRTNTPELGLLPTTEPEAYGPTRNPWDLTRSAGGSSGGAAAAVASGMVPAAHASDGGGSIRIPAALCGLVGLKPTRGRSSFGPGLGERWAGFSCEGVVSRSVRDTAAFLDLTRGAMPGDPYFAAPPSALYLDNVQEHPGPLKIGVMGNSPRDAVPLHAECLIAVKEAAELLEQLGHHVEAEHPKALDETATGPHYITVVACNIAETLQRVGAKIGCELDQRSVEPLTWAIAEIGRSTPAPDYIAHLREIHRFSRDMAAWWEGGFDLLLTPTTAEPAPVLGEYAQSVDEPMKPVIRAIPFGAFTSAFNLTGQPGISLPLHWSESGLPVGVQLVAAYGREDLLLSVAAQLEAAAPWADHRPPVFA